MIKLKLQKASSFFFWKMMTSHEKLRIASELHKPEVIKLTIWKSPFYGLIYQKKTSSQLESRAA